MSKRLIIILLLVPVLCFQAYSQERHNDQLLREEVSRFGQAFVKIQYPGKQALNELSGKVS
ncbi:MAG TPA: hypothetical protein VFB97_03680, partial [Bacteroidales bacterium]|nr:hypothetical protein [Bacteroidales bacterium]